MSIDELDCMQRDGRGTELLFRALTEREENSSVAVASSESFGKAHKFPANLCQAVSEQRGFLEREINELDVSFVS